MIDLIAQDKNREISIFVSSTSRDMMVERNHLVKQVFPKLRKQCPSRGVELTK